MNPKTQKITLLFSVIGIFLFNTSLIAQTTNKDAEMEELKKLIIAKSRILKSYVDSIDDHKLTEYAIRGMLRELDPHSTYIPSEELQEKNEQLEGEFEGIGVQFMMQNDTAQVEAVISGGPAEKVGIQPGDRIVTVNDTLIAGTKIKNKDLVKKIRGEKGTFVRLGIARRGNKDLISFNIKRDKVPLNSVDTYYMIDQKTGYIKLSKFSEKTKNEISKAINSLKEQGMEKLIFDLQGNGGGYVNAAVNVCDQFLGNEKIIVSTKGRKNSRTYKATKKGLFENGKLIILIDQYSASASEIVSGAIQDHDRGTIVGRRSFGKGLVQQPILLTDNSMMRLTVARYYTPSGRCIQKPYNAGTDNYEKDLIDRYNRGELSNADSIHFPDSLKYSTLTLGRTVYGGGGIMPDIFVPIDTTHNSPFYTKLIASAGIHSVTTILYDKNVAEWKKTYLNSNDFIANFQLSEEMLLPVLKQIAEKEKIKWETNEIEQSKAIIKQQIKALIGRRLFDEETFYRIIKQLDNTYLKAIELIK